jgi:hypothetical protein
MWIDLILTFVLGILIGMAAQRCRVIYVREDEFDIDDPNLPEWLKAELKKRKLDD